MGKFKWKSHFPKTLFATHTFHFISVRMPLATGKFYSSFCLFFRSHWTEYNLHIVLAFQYSIHTMAGDPIHLIFMHWDVQIFGKTIEFADLDVSSPAKNDRTKDNGAKFHAHTHFDITIIKFNIYVECSICSLIREPKIIWRCFIVRIKCNIVT